MRSLIWVAETSYNPSNRATWEKIDLRYKDDYRFTMGLESRVVCEWDPWRKFLAKPCESIFDTPKGEMPSSLLSHLRQSQVGIPFTSILDSAQRAALDKNTTSASPFSRNLLTPSKNWIDLSHQPSFLWTQQSSAVLHHKQLVIHRAFFSQQLESSLFKAN